MFWPFAMIWLLCCGFPVPLHASADTIVDIKAEAAPSGKTMVLSDVAEITGPSAQELSVIPIMKTPGGSYDVILSKRTIEEKVRSRYKGPVIYRGAKKTHVSSCRVQVSEEALKKAFIDEILKNSPSKGVGKIEVEDVRVPRCPAVLKTDSDTIRAKFSPHDDYLGLTTATMIIGRGPSPERVTVSGRVRLIADVPVAKTKIPAGRIINASELVMKSMDISSSPGVIVRVEECEGKRARVTIREGKAILSSQVELKPDVCLGDVVSIEARVKDLVVMDKGIALKDGFKGEPIPVKNCSSGRRVVGTIIAASLVTVKI